MISVFHAPRVFATLGGSIDSVSSDQSAMKTTRKVMKTSMPAYSIHEIQSDSVNVKEYVSQDGVVFAITWSGNRHPDFEPLLGAYHPDYQYAEQTTPKAGGARSRFLQGPRLLVHTWGHPRHLRGRMLDPALVPTGVNLNEIK
jgi:hypothetical protein